MKTLFLFPLILFFTTLLAVFLDSRNGYDTIQVCWCWMRMRMNERFSEWSFGVFFNVISFRFSSLFLLFFGEVGGERERENENERVSLRLIEIEKGRRGRVRVR